ncbi:chemotaxis protein CheW [Novilysobacter defluvii]|uniref:Chemotaxis protein CheW n=1 Tax=Lysobacter defluvii IMMIB APB-9 = DSM 18482 TaxID=1385515 RepID=A0A0A0M976_9GAMM|nr:chemotaxis protein CheW [Lysobacter defluvii]KGO98512.1 chemotaxis protein CheW [Lysobacter defluvii IMMIB APB-9 = DSM 18482]
MNIPHNAGNDAPRDIRGVLVQVAGARLLLPNASIAEVLSYAEPEPVPGAPDWLLGRMRWRGWPVPLVAAARMAGARIDVVTLGTKVLVFKALGGDPRLPYFAVLSNGFPRLVTISRGTIRSEPDGTALPQFVKARVALNDEVVLIPDLEAMQTRISQVLDEAGASADMAHG